jgi:dolichol kinase
LKFFDIQKNCGVFPVKILETLVNFYTLEKTYKINFQNFFSNFLSKNLTKFVREKEKEKKKHYLQIPYFIIYLFYFSFQGYKTRKI